LESKDIFEKFAASKKFNPLDAEFKKKLIQFKGFFVVVVAVSE